MTTGLHYRVQVPRPADHLVHVELTIPCAALADHVDVTLPAWCPGSYLIRDYARLVRDLTVVGDDGAPRVATKIDKSTWRVARAGAARLVVRYRIYGHELTVRTNHVDPSHAFLHGPATFAYCPALRTAPVAVEVVVPAGWTVTTALAPSTTTDELAADVLAFTAPSVDALLDSPIHLGVVTRHAFTAAGVPFELAVWGDRAPGGLYTFATLVADLTAIADDHARRLGATPFDRYAFVLMLSHDAYGGLEHRASSINLNHPRCLATRKDYEGLLELLSHELFHAWNGKRIAPTALTDFDYSREAYTRCLWVMEGMTSHYDRFALRSAGRVTGKSFLDKVLDDWTRLMAVPGRRRQSLEDASFDAWIKLYKPDESNLNTTVSYYLKGGLVMLALDLAIRRRTDGGRSLDDCLRALWTGYGARGVGHPEDVQPLFERAVELSLGEVFDRQIRGVDDPDLAGELAHVGVELRALHDPAQVEGGAHALWIGATLAGARVTGVLDDGPGDRGGLAPGDELVAIDDLRVTGDADARAIIGMRQPGDAIDVAVFRRQRLTRVAITLAVAPPTRWELHGLADAKHDARGARYQAWLGEPHPGAELLAGVTTTSRAI